ncbi:MAG: membrane-bound lytic murein transglycosylase MltF, partial [Gammaproteobacteria bacterium]|nr:membrane-bound lytic murein transglycosylase MltF [Gammaproteobacteria bacterium]
MKNRILYITPVTAAVFGGILWLTSGSTNQFRNVPVFGQTYLEEIRDKGEVTIATRNSPTTFYEGRDGTYQGFEYDLIENFAQKMGIKTRFIVKDSINEIFEAIDTGEAMVAAAGLSISPTRMQKYLFGPSYQQVNQQVVCRRGNPMPSTLEGLKDVTLWVASETSYIERLMILKQQIPELKWQTVKDLDTEQLLEKVWNEEVNCTIADSNIVAINNRYYPELYVAFNLGDADNLAWALPLKAYELQAQMRLWLHEIHENGELDRLHDRYYGFAESFDYVDTTRFQQRVKTRLPRYIDLFHKYAEENNLPWSLLAAQSYQESNWRPRAMSPTGVRGMMMLTLPTAADMGVSSRLNAEQSI